MSANTRTGRSREQPLPKGLKPAAPIANKKLLNLLKGEDITISGGTRSVVNGRPLLGAQAAHR
ncbi:MAG TPA: hypothetical protein VGI81_12065 [Tepidisphaeraceae bacterium]|jgi:hypothetical protein